MSASLSLIGFGAFLVGVSCAGAYLLVLGRRSPRLPELLLGSALLFWGPFGQGLIVLGRLLGPAPGSPESWAIQAGVVGQTLGAAALYIFTWRFFRPHARGVRIAMLVVLAALATSGAADAIHRGWFNIDGEGPAYWTACLLRVPAFFWLCGESLRFRRWLKRRGASGGDPDRGTARLLWWAVGAGLAGLAATVWLGSQAWTGVSPVHLPTVNGAVSLAALAAAAAATLAFRASPGAPFPAGDPGSADRPREVAAAP